MKMKIIGHRGVPSLKLENTLASFKEAVRLGVPMIELDVHLTADNHVVVCHDSNLEKVGGGNHEIAELTYEELKKLPLANGDPAPLLAEVLEVIKDIPVVVEIKAKGAVDHVLKIIDEMPHSQVRIASPHIGEIEQLKKLRKDISGYIRSLSSPFEVIYLAKSLGADGIDLNFWILNPLTYWMARRNDLDIMVFTVNNRFVARFIHLLYPRVMICTNYPQKFLPRKRRRQLKKS